MALSQKGAAYSDRAYIKDPHVLRALDDLASQTQALENTTTGSKSGVVSPPHPLTSIVVVKSNGFATITLTHNNAPSGARYIVQASTSASFSTPVHLADLQIDSGSTVSSMHYLKGQTLYFRAAPKFPTSSLAAWTYFGNPASPTPTSF